MNPVIRGRDLLGAPKLLADVPDLTRQGNDWYGRGCENGNLLLDVTVTDATPKSVDDLKAANADMADDHWMGWKYIPNVDGKGAAVSHPTLIGRDITIAEAWTGKGSVSYGDLTWEANPWSVDVVDALKSLDIKEYRGATVNHGSMTVTRALNRVLA